MRFSEHDESAAEASHAKADTLAEQERVRHELAAVDKRLMDFQDEKGLLINMLLDSGKQKAQPSQTVPRWVNARLHNEDAQEAQPPAEAAPEPSAPQNFDEQQHSPEGPRVGSVLVRDSVAVVPGRRPFKSMQHALKSSLRGTAPTASQALKPEASAGSWSAVRRLQRTLRPQLSFPAALMQQPRSRAGAEDAHPSDESSMAADSVAASVRRSSTGAMSTRRQSECALSDLDTALLRTPPRPHPGSEPQAESLPSAAKAGVDVHSGTSMSTLAEQNERRDKVTTTDHRAPRAMWSVFNSTFERDSPERARSAASNAGTFGSPEPSSRFLQSIWPFKRDALQATARPTAEAVSDSGVLHGGSAAAVADSLDLDCTTPPVAGTDSTPPHSGVLHVVHEQQGRHRSVSWQRKLNTKAASQPGLGIVHSADESSADAADFDTAKPGQLEASPWQEVPSDAGTSHASARTLLGGVEQVHALPTAAAFGHNVSVQMYCFMHHSMHTCVLICTSLRSALVSAID